MADEPEVEPTAEQRAAVKAIESWVRTLLMRSGVRVVNFGRADDVGPAPMGLLNVPGKYCRIIDAMHEAMVSIQLGQPLPEFVPLPPVKVPKKVRRK